MTQIQREPARHGRTRRTERVRLLPAGCVQSTLQLQRGHQGRRYNGDEELQVTGHGLSKLDVVERVNEGWQDVVEKYG